MSHPGFWEKVGPELRELQLVNCIATEEVLYRILRECPKLESFELTGKFPKIISSSKIYLNEESAGLTRPFVLEATRIGWQLIEYISINRLFRSGKASVRSVSGRTPAFTFRSASLFEPQYGRRSVRSAACINA